MEDLQRWTALRDKILRYHWEYYGSLAYQRSRITGAIREALLGAAEKPFEFSRWQRVVKYRYALEPLSAAGSLFDIGGRFNIGDIDQARFPPFPALYLAEDRPTALQESLAQDQPPRAQLSTLEFAMTKSASIVTVSVSGSLDAVIDLNKPEKLQGFVNHIKDFVVPGHLLETTKDANWDSHVVLDDEAPPEARLRRLDAKSWQEIGRLLAG